MIQILCLIFFCIFPTSFSELMDSYFINSDYSFRNPLPYTTPDIACLRTDISQVIPLAAQVTLCYRAQPLIYIRHENPWSSVIGFGTIKPDFSDIEEGINFGVYDDKLWFGFKRRSKAVLWISLGENMFTDLHVWRHLCLSIDFEEGSVKLGDNGQVSVKTQSDGIRQLGSTMNYLGVGCFYKSTGTTKYQSMYGRVSDVQMFSRILADEEMIEITGCKSRAEGDILAWSSTNWIQRWTQGKC